MTNDKITFFWFRRDLRLDDNIGLYNALKAESTVLPIFIFDKDILDHLEDKQDARVAFIHNTLIMLKNQLEDYGSSLIIRDGNPLAIWKSLVTEFNIKFVYCNHDYEPYAIQRDLEIEQFLASKSINFCTFKDQCIFEKGEVVKEDGKPYTVFTPYSRKWKAKLELQPIVCVDSLSLLQENLAKISPIDDFKLEAMGFLPTNTRMPTSEININVLQQYAKHRDYPSIAGTSRISVHLRFGTISIRRLALLGMANSETWLNELIWRDFYMMILYFFPHVKTRSFKPQYDRIQWRNNKEEFQKWCDGQTGYPIVDAGMRELNTTGFMHNRVRMIVASFLVKHLLIDWRWGEAYFAKKLLDFDLSANNGGWQWAAGSGCDAAPYFRVFNPYLQTQKFDSDMNYIKKWVPEFQEFTYPKPIVNHEFARNRVLEVYKMALQ